jgi:hypothetical protein
MPGILGVDSGINGGCALYLPGADVPTVTDGVFDIPTVGDGNKREIDGLLLSRMIWALRPDYAFVEIVNAFMPKRKNPETGEEEVDRWGGTSLFRFGGAYHSILTVLACLEIPTRRVRAPEWQAAFGLQGKSKSGTDAARQVVLQRYPAFAPYLKYKNCQHKAEAILIGVYGSRKIRREEENLNIPD